MNIHDNLVLKLYNNPQYLGIEPMDVRDRLMEVPLIKKSSLYTQVDLYIATDMNDYYFEIKSVNSHNAKKKGNYQIKKINNWIKTYDNSSLGKSRIALVHPMGHQKTLINIVNNLSIKYLK